MSAQAKRADDVQQLKAHCAWLERAYGEQQQRATQANQRVIDLTDVYRLQFGNFRDDTDGRLERLRGLLEEARGKLSSLYWENRVAESSASIEREGLLFLLGEMSVYAEEQRKLALQWRMKARRAKP